MSRGTCQRAAAATAAGTAQSWPNLLTLLFSAFSPSLCPFFLPFILCVTPLTPTHLWFLFFFCLSCSFYLWQSVATGPHALLSATRSHRRPRRQNPGGIRFKVGVSLIPFHRILPAVSSLSITFSSSPFLTTPPPRCACIYNVQTCSPYWCSQGLDWCSNDCEGLACVRKCMGWDKRVAQISGHNQVCPE